MANNNRVQPMQRGWVLRGSGLKSIIIFLTMLVLTNPDISGISRILYWGVLLVCAGGLLLNTSGRRWRIQINGFAVWTICFLLICTVSLIYSADSSTSWDVVKGQIVNAILVLCILWNTHNEEDLYTLIKIMFWVIVFNGVYLVSIVDWSTIGTDRMGTDYTGESWNANAIGMMFIWGTLFAIYLRKTLNNKKYYLSLPLFLLLIVFSGSRKAWLGALMVLVVFVLVSNRKHMLRALLIAIGAVAILYYLIMNVDWLYDIGGQRLESLIQGVSGKGDLDSSAEKRLDFIALGWEWFQEKPLFGHGVHAFGSMLYNTGYHLQIYSHNNYIELLVGVGIVGTLVYYIIYVLILWRLLKKVCKERKSEPEQFAKSALQLAFVAIGMIMHYGMVVYTEMFDTILILIPYVYLKTSHRTQMLQVEANENT